MRKPRSERDETDASPSHSERFWPQACSLHVEDPGSELGPGAASGSSGAAGALFVQAPSAEG